MPVNTLKRIVASTHFRRWSARMLLAAWVLVGVDVVAQSDSLLRAKADSAVRHKSDSITQLENRRRSRRESTQIATQRAIQLRDTVNNPRPLRPDEIRADRKEHLLAVTGVTLLAALTFLLYNLRSR